MPYDTIRSSSVPTVSVIIPAYNCQETIFETISSVINQTFHDLEVVIINDGSTDNTLKVVESISDTRVKAFSYENGGLATARNRGIRKSSGKFIAFLDADDIWKSNKLESQIKALQDNQKAGVAYSWSCYLSEDGSSFHTDRTVNFEGDVYADLLVKNFLESGSNPLVRKEAIDSVGYFDASVSGAADWDYWLKLAAKWNFALVPEVQVYYRQSNSSMSSRVEFMESCILSVLETAFSQAPEDLQHLKNQSLAEAYRYSAQMCVSRKLTIADIRLGWSRLLKSLSLSPNNIFQVTTQKIALKLLLASFLTPKLSSVLFNLISMAKAKSINKRMAS